MRLDRNGWRLYADLGAAVNDSQSHDSFLEFEKNASCASRQPRSGGEWIRDVNGHANTVCELPKCSCIKPMAL